jgi:hypothetical protein
MITHETEIHPVAMMFPEMSDGELAELANDIKENGLIEPIWTHADKVIDGRNRLAACQIAGVEPTFREWKGNGSLVGFVMSLNLHRRHLTASQKATLAVEIKPMLAAEIAAEKAKKCSEAGKSGGRGNRKPDSSADEKGSATKCETVSSPEKANRDARKEAAKATGTNHKYVTQAEQIAAKSPETFDQVKRGDKTIGEATRELGLTPPKPTGKCRVNGELVDDPPDIAERRAAGKIPKNAVVEIYQSGDPTSLADIQEEYAERAAIQDDLSDEDWLETLPLASQLHGKPLAIFKDHAVLWRSIEPYRKAFASGIAPLIKKPRKRIGYVYRVNAFIGINHPKNWRICPSTQDGGCAGTGETPVFGGECPKCWSAGFLIR